LRRNIDVADIQKEHVSEGFQVPEGAGSILHDAIDAFCYGVGQSGFDEGAVR
jgi:hypothetical protein